MIKGKTYVQKNDFVEISALLLVIIKLDSNINYSGFMH